MDEIFQKGRHIGKSFENVFENDKLYSKFIFQQATGLTDDFQKFKEWMFVWHTDDNGRLILNPDAEFLLEALSDHKVKNYRLSNISFEYGRSGIVSKDDMKLLEKAYRKYCLKK